MSETECTRQDGCGEDPCKKKRPRAYKDSNIWTYRAAAIQWLRYVRQCPIVSIERGIGPCIPDVMACGKSRFLIEVEIKRTMADFRANASKRTLKARDSLPQFYPVPRQFYFLVPAEMLEKVRAELPDRCGLLSFGKPSTLSGIPELQAVVAAKSNPLARRLNARELVIMAKAQSGTLFTVMKALHRNPELCADDDWAEMVEEGSTRLPMGEEVAE